MKKRDALIWIFAYTILGVFIPGLLCIITGAAGSILELISYRISQFSDLSLYVKIPSYIVIGVLIFWWRYEKGQFKREDK